MSGSICCCVNMRGYNSKTVILYESTGSQTALVCHRLYFSLPILKERCSLLKEEEKNMQQTSSQTSTRDLLVSIDRHQPFSNTCAAQLQNNLRLKVSLTGGALVWSQRGLKTASSLPLQQTKWIESRKVPSVP